MKYISIVAFIATIGAATSFAQRSETTQTVQTVTVTETTNVVQTRKATGAKKVAIFVRNDSGKSELNGKDKALEFSLSARLNNMGFSVINHDLAIRNLNEYLGDDNAKYRTEAAALKKKMDSTESQGSQLFENAGGLRICEFIGADYIVSVSYASLGREKKSFSGYGVKTINTMYKLRSNYNLYEGGMGSGTAGGAIKSAKTVRQTENMDIDNNDILDELIDDTAEQMANLLREQNSNNQIVAKEDSSGEIKIIYQIESMSFPEITKDANGNYIVGTNAIPATIPYVNADIDGVAQTIGGTISLSKGLHSFKVKQRDIVPVEKNIFVTGKPGQTIAFTLQLTDEARQRWKEDMEFIEKMKDKAKKADERRILTEAEAAKLRGMAKMFEQSGFKVDAKALPNITQKSLF